MDATKLRVWFSPDYPAGLVIEETDGSLRRLPDLTPFDGDRSALQPVRAGGEPAFPGEFFMDPVGVAEIAERAAVDVGTVHAWRSRHDDFPPPLAALRAGPVWTWATVERWLRLRPPVGRPRRYHAGVARIPIPVSPVLRHLRGDGTTTTYRLRDRFEPGSVSVEIDGIQTPVIEDEDGRRFTLPARPRRGADIKLQYRSILG